MNPKDYYQTLEINRSADQQQIKEAYRKLAFQYHPDKNKGNRAATERMKEINEAYAVLSDSKKRREYDSLSQQYGSFIGYDKFRQTYSEQDIFKGSDIKQIFEEMAKIFPGFRNFDELFRESYGTRYQNFEFRRPGFFGWGFVVFSPLRGFEKRYKGRQEQIYQTEEMPSLQQIQLPGIFGRLIKYALKNLGKRYGIEWSEKGKDWRDVIYLTPEEAQGEGKIKYPYRKRGKSKDLILKVPSEIKEGQQIRLKGMGSPGKGRGQAGDLYLKVLIRVPLPKKIKNLLKQVGF